MHDKLFAGICLCLCLALGIVAWGYHAPFSYEPVGPRAYPLLLLGLLIGGCLYLLLKPGTASTSTEEPPLDRKVLGKVSTCILLFIVYAATFEYLGFILSSALFGVAMSRLYAGSWTRSLVAGVILAVGLYWLFDKALDVPLPLGWLEI